MKNRKLTSSGDYSFGAGANDYIDGDEAIGQAIKTKILLFYGEWWEDTGNGIPMFQSFLGQTNPETIKTSLADIIEKRVLEVDGVRSVKTVDVQLNKNTRTMSFEIEVVTVNNTTTTVEVTF